MSGVQMLMVEAGEGDQRIDRWLRRRFPHVGQGRIEKMCRKGELRLDGGRVKPATRVEEGQSVRVPPLPEPGEMPAPAPKPKVGDKDAEMIRACVIYRDDHVIAINKPHGLPTQGGSKQTRHVDGLSEALKFGYEEKPRLVHRLDKDTSGVLLLARTRAAATALTAAIRHRAARKIYWAVVAGVPTPYLGEIKYGLVKAPGHGAKGEGEKMLCIHPREINSTPGAKRAIGGVSGGARRARLSQRFARMGFGARKRAGAWFRAARRSRVDPAVRGVGRARAGFWSPIRSQGAF